LYDIKSTLEQQTQQVALCKLFSQDHHRGRHFLYPIDEVTSDELLSLQRRDENSSHLGHGRETVTIIKAINRSVPLCN